MLKTDRLLIIV